MFTPANQHPSTVILLLAGVVTVFGLMGVGRLTCRAGRISAAGQWEAVLWSLSGILLASLTVVIAGVCFSATRGFWGGVWLLTASIGLWQLIDRIRALDWTELRTWLRDPFVLIALAANIVTLLIALAPSSKFDELYYHMLAPQRVLTDGGLHFYRFPWQSAILPQMHYQLSQTPLYAIGLPDAANVLSWCYSVLLQIFIARVVTSSGRSLRLAALAVACVSVGMIPAVWHVTAGSHAVGHLASAALLILVAHPDCNAIGSAGRSTIVIASILAVAAASTKLTLLPLAFVSLLWLIIRESRSAERPVWTLIQLAVMSAAVWLVFYAPLAVFTASYSGSPVAVVMPGSTGPSAYAPGEAEHLLSHSRAINQADPPAFLFQSGVGHSPLLWLAAIAFLIAPATSQLRVWWATITAIELLVVMVFTHNDLRFLAGYPSAAIALFLTQGSPRILNRLQNSGRFVLLVGSLGTIPWLLGMTWYAGPFAECSLGLETREGFVEQYTALRRDFLALDKLLPRDAVLLVTTGRINSVSAPRPVVYDVRDLPSSRPVYLLSINSAAPEGMAVKDAIYINESAVTAVYRRPGQTPRRGTVHVFRLDQPAP